ncbi:MAG: hypothetical protein Q4E94_02365 [Clostridia bacterium]|nr:hypothetical protein [Clostridia bacterium]
MDQQISLIHSKQKTQKKIWMICLAFVTAFVCAILCEQLFFAQNNVLQSFIASNLDASKNQTYYLENFDIVNYSINGNTITSTTDDGQLCYSNINQYITDITIDFDTPVAQDSPAVVYYTYSNLETYSEQTALRFMLCAGDSELSIPFNHYISSLRIDLGNIPQETFSISQINIRCEALPISCVFQGLFDSVSGERILLLTILFMFIALHFILNIKKMYNWMFRYRYVVATAIVVFLVCMQYNFSSISMFDQYIQPGEGSEYVQPVFGSARPIRSDEWLVGTPKRLSTAFDAQPYGQYSYIMRGTQTSNAAIAGTYLNYASLATPLVFGTFFLGNTFGLSIAHCGMLVFSFMVSFELCLILTKQKRLLSLAGAFLIVCSSYFMWWSYPGCIITAQAAIVCFYYYLHAKKLHSRILYSFGLGIFLAWFVVTLYPAWQVPICYLFVGLLIWVIASNRDKFQTMKWHHWLILVGAFVLTATLVLTYLRGNADYVKGMSTSVYPGHRVSTGGEPNMVSKLFLSAYAPLYPFMNISNPSEMSSFLTFFPLPIIASIWYMCKTKKRDFLSIFIIAFSAIMISYIVFGWPEKLCTLTLMSYSMPCRVVDIIGVAQIYLLMRVLSRYNKPEIPRVKAPIAIAIGGIIGILSIYSCNSMLGAEISIQHSIIKVYAALVVVGFAFSGFILLATNKTRIKNIFCLALIAISVITGLTVHPLQKGLDAIYSKPLAQVVQTIIQDDPDAKWISVNGGIVPQQFLVACGAPTINSVNIYPNLELWKKLDPDKEYNDVYNRYAHIDATLTSEDTSFELIQADFFHLNLSYRDLALTKVSYLYSATALSKTDLSNPYASFELIYEENGSYIYKIHYLK